MRGYRAALAVLAYWVGASAAAIGAGVVGEPLVLLVWPGAGRGPVFALIVLTVAGSSCLVAGLLAGSVLGRGEGGPAMTVKQNTSDIDARRSAISLLEAAAGLAVDVTGIRTVSGRGRIDFDAPAPVYGRAQAAGFLPQALQPIGITATVTAHDPGGGGNIQVTVEISDTTPKRDVTVVVGSFTRNISTGDTLAGDIQFAAGWTGAMVTLTDDDSAVTSGEVELVMAGADGELAVTISVPRV